MATESRKTTHPAVAGLAIALVVAVVGFVALSMFFPIQLRENRLYLTEERPGLDFRFDALSQNWSEADLRKHFEGKPIKCYSNQQTGGLGDKVCNVDIASHNGARAMGAAFFFDQGKLDNVRVSVPWWAHDQMLQTTLRLYGGPSAAQPRRIGGLRLVGWKLPDGSGLFYNIDRHVNPLMWSAVFWRSGRACASESGCFER